MPLGTEMARDGGGERDSHPSGRKDCGPAACTVSFISEQVELYLVVWIPEKAFVVLPHSKELL